MTGRTDFAALRTHSIAQGMGVRLSRPAEVVQADCDPTTMRFSRTLDERAPHVRSGQAWIVDGDAPVPMHPGDLAVCIVGVLLMILAVGWLL